ncbi:MFS transporter [Pontiella sulfatireligans]|uniref:Major facilitator superfamily (MFS) profile domain-containing protein n=1 Tax=Pontiella sulfatireligans TaxID=2750658 RepID=A0A6C2UKI5_9BACT|nr:MFS transporter [Pontiella sulfatireligans]VGO19927.1 hypothetical protein SCARR_01987 [Pontiella sulfatireligans]
MKDQNHEFKTTNMVSVAETHLLHDTYSSFFAPLIPLLTEKLGFAYAMAGTPSVVQKLPSLLINPLVGIMADKTVTRSGIIAAPIVTIVTMSLMEMAPSVTLLAIMQLSPLLMFLSTLASGLFQWLLLGLMGLVFLRTPQFSWP